MAKNYSKKQSKKETAGMPYADLLSSVRSNYDAAKAELDVRVEHKVQGFDEADRLYRSHIDKTKWPFNSSVFVPLTFTSLYGKGTRLVTGKIKGRLVAGQYGNELGAAIGTELLSAQYDEHDEYFGEPLVSKWLRMDQNARKYGAAWGFVGWRHEVDGKSETVFDGPTFEVLDNRKVYTQPGATSEFDSDWIIVERTVTLEELERVNERSMARTGQLAYENLGALKGMAEASVEHDSLQRRLRSLPGTQTGKGGHKPYRMLTEYRRDKWISWLPDVGNDKDDDKGLGLVVRCIDNPYEHGMLPIIRLVYIPIDDDIYGVAEHEPVRSEQKATNALVSGFIDAVSTELYPIIKGHPTNVDWKTIEFKPRAAWIMNNPQTDVVRMEGAITFTRNFVEAYKLLISQFAQAMGDTTTEGSQLAALGDNKTATEIKDLALQRGSRDNINKLFLSAAISRMYTLWWRMDQQFLPEKKIIRVAGKDAIKMFVDQGLSEWTLSDEGYQRIANFMEEYPEIGDPETGVKIENDFATAYELLREAGELEPYAMPLFPIRQQGQQLPKLQMNDSEMDGFLTVERNDLTGRFRYSVDLNTIGMPNPTEEAQTMIGFLDQVKELAQVIEAKEGYKVKFKDLVEAIGTKAQIKNTEQFFEKLTQEEQVQQQMMAQGGAPMGDPNQLPQPTQVPQGPEQQLNPQDLLGGQMPQGGGVPTGQPGF